MNRDQIINAMGGIDNEMIQKVDEARAKRKRSPNTRRWISVAASVILIISAALTAEATSGTVSNLLAPLFGGAQTEIVDKIGVPIGASTSVNGYTLTVDAIIGDRYSVMIAYTLSRDDGQPIPENIDFESFDLRGSGYRTRIEIDEENPSIAHFHGRLHRNEKLLKRTITPSFSDLVTNKGAENESMVAEGTWEITFTIRYPDASENLHVKNFDITDAGGRKYKVKDIVLSPLGIHLDLVFYEPDCAESIFKDFHMSLIMADGTKMPLDDGGGGGGWTTGDKKADIDYYAEFDIPIPREDIKAIVICDAVYELPQN